MQIKSKLILARWVQHEILRGNQNVAAALVFS